MTNASIGLSTLGDSALSIPIEKRDTIYSSDSLSQPNSRSVGIGTALLLLWAHSIHPPSLLLIPFVLHSQWLTSHPDWLSESMSECRLDSLSERI